MKAKILITAFACNPERGSEPGVGHYFISQLAPHFDLTVITEAIENRAAIQRLQKNDELYAGVRFHFLPWPKLKRDGRRRDDTDPFRYYLFLKQWESRAFHLAQEICAQDHYALAHHLTMQGYREPGFLWRLPLPFVWGPVGGHGRIPWNYFGIFGVRGVLQHSLRNVGNWLQSVLFFRVRKAARTARAVIVNTSFERDAFRKLYGVEAAVIAEFGSQPAATAARRRNQSGPLRIVWSGVHVARKGLPILLRAAAQVLPHTSLQVHILSDGPERQAWMKMAKDLGLGPHCIWHGRLPREEALKVMAAADVFALTSLLDGTSCVLNEAIALGLPVICHRCCGFPDVVDEGCGILLPVENPRLSYRNFANALSRFAHDETFYNRMADGSLARARWLARNSPGEKMRAIYNRVLSRENPNDP